ncbi:PLP-dependent aminotransferase family protein [Pseudoalteromonas denitrificans]|uniref:DNA-binding transcriptional regulator, MocR family, contains an aminotransferase domain n=1 Tax=Pseudoalteromonas denitrificans DSM 6059 TaxID=1123010 RepID=A0A1I1QZR2_9GAMM|nr:PLP-dependent aminotransferase family protein [Pseudoalteromonas denitrificans]SFD27614.1 DNA-binding transcriptional regulator, MocR family, contains an aminotransferase domain [Pseudoalteromonas denitrificans DSM 6059]
MWSPDLTLGEGPLYIRLVEAMTTAIKTGELKVGDKLPAQRQLAWHLEINLSTVTKAFTEATKRHLICGEVGRGTYILAQSTEAALFNLKQNTQNQIIDLSTHVPATRPDDTHLSDTLSTLLSEEHALEHYLNYLSPQLIQRMRVASALWLNSLGFSVTPQNCINTSCAQSALQLVLLECCNSDDTILVDELTFPGIKAAAKQLNLKLHGVKMDEQGITPDALDLAIRSTNAKVLVSDPNLQNPTGRTLSKQRQKDLITIIKQHKILFIEEYVIGALSEQPPISNEIKSQSILITSFAKAVAPGVRFAIVASEHSLINKLANEPHATTWQLSPLIAEIACRWIFDGTVKKRTLWQQAEIHRRFRLFKTLFANNLYAQNIKVCSHVWLAVNKNADLVAKELSDLGVEVVPASLFAVGRFCPNNIRISLTAAASLQTLKIGLEIILHSGFMTECSPSNE